MSERAFVLSEYRCTLCTSVFLFTRGQGDGKHNTQQRRVTDVERNSCV